MFYFFCRHVSHVTLSPERNMRCRIGIPETKIFHILSLSFCLSVCLCLQWGRARASTGQPVTNDRGARQQALLAARAPDMRGAAG